MYANTKQTAINGTWIDPESNAYPNNTFTRHGQAILVRNPHCALDLPYGKLISFRARVPDTFSSIPARFVYRGENVLNWTGTVHCYVRMRSDRETLELVPEACTIESTDERGTVEVSW